MKPRALSDIRRIAVNVDRFHWLIQIQTKSCDVYQLAIDRAAAPTCPDDATAKQLWTKSTLWRQIDL